MIHTRVSLEIVWFPFTSSTDTVGHLWPTVLTLVRKVKGNPRNFAANVCGSLYSIVKHLSNYMHFITNGYQRFLKTNSTDPRQRVPLTIGR